VSEHEGGPAFRHADDYRRLERAIAALRRALDLNPNHVKVTIDRPAAKALLASADAMLRARGQVGR